jgi:hypothetical protein
MQTYRISSRATGTILGDYRGELIADAIEAYARDAGYRSFADLCATLGVTDDEATNDLRVVEVV